MNRLLIPQISKMLVLMLIGFFLSRMKLVQGNESKGLSVVCLYVTTPCAILSGFQIEFTQDLFHNLLFSFLVVILLHIVLLAISFGLRQSLHFSAVERVATVYPNCGNLVIPLVIAMLGTD
ncbi:hypothetical protein SDC9_133587 [bioreactor metagenome]|uniref:Transporter YfdV n=1 Tax=bioreactor metagenome TaxID=1076179 RepID=A0A645DBV0_9ZZZZ